MIAFVLRRVIQAVIVMLTVGLVSFSLFRYVGDPVLMMVDVEDTAEFQPDLRERLGLNDPAVVQFSRFVWNATQGEFGFSYHHRRPVSDLIAERLPATLELVLCSGIFALLAGVPMKVYSGLHRDSWLSQVFQSVSLIGISMPTFLAGILLILCFSVVLNVLPSFGRGDVVAMGWWSTGFFTMSGLKAHRSRTHLSLGKDTPEGRSVQPDGAGKIVAFPQVGGLHHRYERLAA